MYHPYTYDLMTIFNGMRRSIDSLCLVLYEFVSIQW